MRRRLRGMGAWRDRFRRSRRHDGVGRGPCEAQQSPDWRRRRDVCGDHDRPHLRRRALLRRLLPRDRLRGHAAAGESQHRTRKATGFCAWASTPMSRRASTGASSRRASWSGCARARPSRSFSARATSATTDRGPRHFQRDALRFPGNISTRSRASASATQHLGPHESAEWPVVFFLDPTLEKDELMARVEFDHAVLHAVRPAVRELCAGALGRSRRAGGLMINGRRQ